MLKNQTALRKRKDKKMNEENISSELLTDYEEINLICAYSKMLILTNYQPTDDEKKLGLIKTAEDHFRKKKIKNFHVIRRFVGFSDSGEVISESIPV